jgi:asparagine synthase (glutamine-hydrolysing)
MCGICGIAGKADENLVGAMADTLVHRGPDGGGVRVFAGAGHRAPATLGHRRLKIIDLSDRAAQPMPSPDDRYHITYNGEVYNYRELKAPLQKAGWQFRSDCDTEVVLAMYAQHGPEMLDRLNGIFALAIWDRERGELFFARDRLGVKPLYYSLHDETFVFASEVKAMLAALPPASLRPEAVADYLTFLWVPEPETMFDGIVKLPAGHAGLWRDGKLHQWRWWDLRFATDERPEREWVELVRDGIGDAVERQLVADVPVGSFLSGGIDSAAIVATTSRKSAAPTAYTVGFSEQDLGHEIVPDDLPYARIVAARFGLDHHERVLEPEIVELLPLLVWHMDEPVADPAAITTYLICKAARERLTVILSGMGGDEVFAGYPRHLAAALGRPLDLVPARARQLLRALVEPRMSLGPPGRLRGPRRNAMKFLRGLDAQLLDRYLIHSSYYRADELRRLWSPEQAERVAVCDPFARHRGHLREVADEHWLHQLLYLDLKTFLPCLNLMYTDKMSMAASTEVRVPLLDDELVRLASHIPPNLKLHRLKRKYVFKRAMEGVLPNEVVWRPKAGFGAPLRSWLVGELAPLVDEMLSPEVVRARGLLDPDEVQRLIAANRDGREDNALRIWALLTLEQWQRTFIDGSAPTAPGGRAAPQGRPETIALADAR